MGLFDSWRRKKNIEPVRLQEPKKVKDTNTETSESKEKIETDDLVGLVAQYERLVQRREELQDERRELTSTLDRGEIDADEFRKELMSRIQEAATVSENLQATAAKLTSLGYRGVLH